MSKKSILIAMAVAFGGCAAAETAIAQPAMPAVAKPALQAQSTSRSPLVRAQFVDFGIGWGPGFWAGYAPGYWAGYDLGPAYWGGYGPGYYGYGGWYPGGRIIADIGVPVRTVGVAVGEAGGVAACERHYRSFDPATGTYTTYSGRQVLCPYLR